MLDVKFAHCSLWIFQVGCFVQSKTERRTSPVSCKMTTSTVCWLLLTFDLALILEFWLLFHILRLQIYTKYTILTHKLLFSHTVYTFIVYTSESTLERHKLCCVYLVSLRQVTARMTHNVVRIITCCIVSRSLIMIDELSTAQQI